MKFFIFIFINFDLILINCFTQRNLKFTIEDEKYKILSKAAKEAFRQIYNITIDFEGRLKEGREDDNMNVEVVIYDDAEIPNVTNKIRFNVTDKSARLEDIPIQTSTVTLFNQAYDIKEQYKILANMIANSFENGFVIIYKKDGEGIVASSRYKCFVENEGKIIGSFEIMQVNKKDKKNKIFELLKKIFSKETVDNAKLVSEFVTTSIAIINSVQQAIKKSATSFLKIPYFFLFLIICLFD